MKPVLEFHPEGGWTTFHTAGLLLHPPELLFNPPGLLFVRGNPLTIDSLPPPPKLP